MSRSALRRGRRRADNLAVFDDLPEPTPVQRPFAAPRGPRGLWAALVGAHGPEAERASARAAGLGVLARGLSARVVTLDDLDPAGPVSGSVVIDLTARH
jgi:hypothetical protein